MESYALAANLIISNLPLRERERLLAVRIIVEVSESPSLDNRTFPLKVALSATSSSKHDEPVHGLNGRK